MTIEIPPAEMPAHCNDDLAYAALDYIREHPEEWDQSKYICRTSCGTTACFAGRVALIARERGMHPYPVYGVSAGIIAQDMLGWTCEECFHVFHNYTSDFTVLETAVKEVLNGEVR